MSYAIDLLEDTLAEKKELQEQLDELYNRIQELNSYVLGTLEHLEDFDQSSLDNEFENIQNELMSMLMSRDKKRRLEYLRGEIEAERISQLELLELQELREYIDKDDVLLLEWAGVPEGADNE